MAKIIGPLSRLVYKPWQDACNPSIRGYELRRGLGLLTKIGFQPYAIYGGGVTRRGLTPRELASLIGCCPKTVLDSIGRARGQRLNKYIIFLSEAEGRIVVRFDRDLVLADLDQIKESFGLGGTRIPRQAGEITTVGLAKLVGCRSSTILTESRKEGGGHLAKYLLPHKRVVKGEDVSVFDEAKILADLDEIKDVFGLGETRKPPQAGEITARRLAKLVGCDYTTILRETRKKGGRLAIYLLPQIRVVSGHNAFVFDKPGVIRDIEQLRAAFGKKE